MVLVRVAPAVEDSADVDDDVEAVGVQVDGVARVRGADPLRVQLAESVADDLDIKHQLELMALLAGTAQTVLVALHDLSLAARYCDRLLLMHQGSLVASGTPEDVLTPARLAEVFEVDAEVGRDPHGNVSVTYRGTAQPTVPGPPRVTADQPPQRTAP